MNVPKAHSVFGNDRPTAHLTTTVLRDDGVSVFRMERFYAEEFTVSDVSKSPKAVSALVDHPLRHRGVVSCGKWGDAGGVTLSLVPSACPPYSGD